MSNSQKANAKLIAFHIQKDFEARLVEGARRHGYSSSSLYARALVMQALGTPEIEIAMTRVGEIRERIQKNMMTLVLGSVKTMTAEELLGEDE